MARSRVVKPMLPAEIGEQEGLAYSLWLPPDARASGAGVVIIHGAGSSKENHHDFARAAVALGLGAIAFDLPGHGASRGPMDDRVLDDVGAIATRLRMAIGDQQAPLALRGSSLGGYLAIVAAAPVRAAAIVAICPASSAGLRAGVSSGRLSFGVDRESLIGFLSAHELEPIVAGLDSPLLLLHAEGDEQVPVEHSRELAHRMSSTGSRLIVIPGGHHRSIQHDEELQAVSLRFIVRSLEAVGPD